MTNAMKKHIITNLFRCMAIPALALAAAACSDWTETEAVEQQVQRPADQDPAFWAEYTAALREYKQSEHFLTYARLRAKRTTCAVCPTRWTSCR